VHLPRESLTQKSLFVWFRVSLCFFAVTQINTWLITIRGNYNTSSGISKWLCTYRWIQLRDSNKQKLLKHSKSWQLLWRLTNPKHRKKRKWRHISKGLSGICFINKLFSNVAVYGDDNNSTNRIWWTPIIRIFASRKRFVGNKWTRKQPI